MEFSSKPVYIFRGRHKFLVHILAHERYEGGVSVMHQLPSLINLIDRIQRYQ